MVAFVGFGGGGGFGFGFGNIGWVPLAPYEVFHPWWGRGFYGANRFNRTVNITNVNITNVYRNARFNNAISAVRVNDFQSGRFSSVSRFNGNQIGQVGAVHGGLPLAPGNNIDAIHGSPGERGSAGHGQHPILPAAAALAMNPAECGQTADKPRRRHKTMDGGDSVHPPAREHRPKPINSRCNRGSAGAVQAPRNDHPAAAAPSEVAGSGSAARRLEQQPPRSGRPLRHRDRTDPQQNNAPVRNQYMGRFEPAAIAPHRASGGPRAPSVQRSTTAERAEL